MKINVLTLFPEMYSPVTTDSILGKANEKGLIEINLINIRDFSEDRHRKVDDTPFGGGCGMLMACQPIFDAMKSIGITDGSKRVLYMSPRGEILSKKLLDSLVKEDEITILAGHYEGVDQRVLDYFNMEEVSIGDYVTTGGELPSMVLIDSLSRFLPGVLGNAESVEDESVYSGLLEADQYTKPKEYMGLTVPDVLTSGNHKEIRKFELMNSLEKTAKKRPDLFRKWVKKTKIDDLTEYTKKERKNLSFFIEKLKEKDR